MATSPEARARLTIATRTGKAVADAMPAAYDRCDAVRSEQIADTVAAVWVACGPMVDRLE